MNTLLEFKSKPNSNNNSYHKMFNNYTDSPQININCGVNNLSLRKIRSMQLLHNTNANTTVLLNQTSSSLLNRNHRNIKFVHFETTRHSKNANSLSSSRKHDFVFPSQHRKRKHKHITHQ